MKTRNGFVSNSSVSSFICHVCGEEFTGQDASPSDFDCSECDSGHVMCNSHIGEIKPVKVDGCTHSFDRDNNKFCSECGSPSQIEKEPYDEGGNVSIEYCPVCQFKIYAEGEMAKYLEKTREVSREDVFAKIKAINKRRKKLYDSEYITHVCEQFELTDDILMEEIRAKFNNHKEYSEFIYEKK